MLTAAPDDRKRILPEEKYNSTNFQTLWDFEGVLRYSPLFYGWYTYKEKGGYRMPFAYFITGLVAYAYSFFATLRKCVLKAVTCRFAFSGVEFAEWRKTLVCLSFRKRMMNVFSRGNCSRRGITWLGTRRPRIIESPRLSSDLRRLWWRKPRRRGRPESKSVRAGKLRETIAFLAAGRSPPSGYSSTPSSWACCFSPRSRSSSWCRGPRSRRPGAVSGGGTKSPSLWRSSPYLSPWYSRDWDSSNNTTPENNCDCSLLGNNKLDALLFVSPCSLHS